MSSEKNEKSEVDVKVTTNTHPDVVRIEVVIAGADGPTRNMASAAIKQAIDSLVGTASKPKN
jgi:hypothetical protein